MSLPHLRLPILLPLVILAAVPGPSRALVFGTEIGFNVGVPVTSPPANLQSSITDEQIDAFSWVRANAEASNTDFVVGALAQDEILDSFSPRAYARSASGYSVAGAGAGTLIPASIRLTGLIDVDGGTPGPDGTVDVILQVTGPGGAGPLSLLAHYEIFSGLGGLFESRQETCLASTGGCETSSVSAITWGEDSATGADSTLVSFLLPAVPDRPLDVILWVLADNDSGHRVTVGFGASTARLNIDPPPGVTVTLDTGQVFATPIPLPAAAPLTGAALMLLGPYARRRRP